jgi:hypothetical protein
MAPRTDSSAAFASGEDQMVKERILLRQHSGSNFQELREVINSISAYVILHSNNNSKNNCNSYI